MAWKRTHPDVSLAYKEWGYDRLRDFLNSMPAVLELKKEEGERDFTIYLVGSQQPKTKVRNGAVGGERSLVTAGLAEVVAAKAGADVAAVVSFLMRPRFRFTIDALAEEFKKPSASQAAGNTPAAPKTEPAQEAKQKKRRDPKPRAPKPQATAEDAPAPAADPAPAAAP